MLRVEPGLSRCHDKQRCQHRCQASQRNDRKPDQPTRPIYLLFSGSVAAASAEAIPSTAAAPGGKHKDLGVLSM